MIFFFFFWKSNLYFGFFHGIFKFFVLYYKLTHLPLSIYKWFLFFFFFKSFPKEVKIDNNIFFFYEKLIITLLTKEYEKKIIKTSQIFKGEIELREFVLNLQSL